MGGPPGQALHRPSRDAATLERARPAAAPGVLGRPVPRRRQDRLVAATPPDQVGSWMEGATVIRAAVWTDLVLPDAARGGPTFTAVAIHDPRDREPLLLATPLDLPPEAVRDR